MKITVRQLKQLIREQVEAQQDAQAVQSATDDIRNPKQATIQQAVAAFKELQQNDPELAAKIKAEAQKMAQKNPQIKQAIKGSSAGGSGMGEAGRPTQGLATALTLMGPLGGAVLGAAAASGALTIPVALLGLGALALGGLGVYGGKDIAVHQKEYDLSLEDTANDMVNTISNQAGARLDHGVMRRSFLDDAEEFLKELGEDTTLNDDQKEERKQEFISSEVARLKREIYRAAGGANPDRLSEMVRREVKRQLRNKR